LAWTIFLPLLILRNIKLLIINEDKAKLYKPGLH
jgi:hypothetical protein